VLLSGFDEYNNRNASPPRDSLNHTGLSSRSVFSPYCLRPDHTPQSIYCVLCAEVGCQTRLRVRSRIVAFGKAKIKLRSKILQYVSNYICMPLMHRLQRKESHGFGKMPRSKSRTLSTTITPSRQLIRQECLR
jgi:hypothetical protein